jgi:bifunctional UDP-N-acetylglucosamine pyrophosphorylase/glucosamine-1-phosphate N-acetyltransferase
MSQPTAILILAAGRGTRMCSQLPKVLHPLAGKPLLGHLLHTVCKLVSCHPSESWDPGEASRNQLKNAWIPSPADAGRDPEKLAAMTNVYLVCGYGADQVKSTFSHFSLNYIEQTEQLGTGHAVKQAFDSLNKFERVLILVGDTPLISLSTLQSLLAIPSNTIGLLTALVANPYGLGRIVRDAKGQLLEIVEEKDATSEQRKINEINTGIMIVPVSSLAEWLPKLTSHNAQGEYYLTDIFAMARSENYPIETVNVEESEIASVNDKIQLAKLERLMQKSQAEELMKQGVTLRDPARFDLRGELTVGQDVVIDINVIIEGQVKIGNRCLIGPNVILRDTTLGHDVKIKSNCDIDGAVIGSKATIGPFARLRPGTELAEEAKIGNFVETKKSKIGKGSKVNHLTYVGDAIVGADVNIGAGVITANYDGVNKWQTTIEEGASIGSNVVLVAPVTIGKEATIGAGSVITTEAPAGELTVSRAKQQTIKGWKRPK